MWEYGLLHFSLLFGFIYSFGVLNGIILLTVFIYVADFVTDKLGYVRLTFIDMLMCFEQGGCNHNLIGFFEMEKVKFEDFEKMVYERGILNIRKLSQIRTYLCGVYYWKDIDREVARKQIIRCTKKLNNEQEVLQYVSEMLSQDMPVDKPLWEFHILEDYTKDTSIVIPKLHHSFTDGIGYISLMSCLTDNKYNVKNTKLVPKPSFLQNLLLYIGSPYFVYKLLFAAKKMKTDPQAAKIRELKDKGDMFVNLYASKLFDFESIKKC